MKLKNPNIALIILAFSFATEAQEKPSTNTDLAAAYEAQEKILSNEQGALIDRKGILFSEISYLSCHQTVTGYALAKIRQNSDKEFYGKAIKMLSVAYCQGHESPSDLYGAISEMANNEQDRSLKDIVNNPPIFYMSPGAAQGALKPPK